MAEIEKQHGAFYEEAANSAGSDSDVDTEFSPQEQRSIVRRVDRRLVSTVGLMYCISLMDRTNLSAANIAGMKVDLAMVGNNRYSLVTLLFFITYIVFQPPSTVIVRKIGPRVHLSTITLLWGAVMIGMGFVREWQQLAALRLVLGIFEAGFFPSCVYLLSTWYTRYEVGKRYSFFYIIGCVASACSGILAYGLMQMKGLASLNGWRWIFIIEGTVTCIIAIGGYWALVGFPDDVNYKSFHFLAPQEIAFIVRKVNRDRGDTKLEPFNLRKFLGAGSDWKIWCYALIFFNTTTVTYALAYFLPIILHVNMKFSIGASQCLVAPPYVFGAFVMYGTGYVGDRFKIRGPLILFNMLLCLIGLPIMGFHSSPAVRYFGVFLVTAGANANVPSVMSYQANNIRGQWKRAFCSATLVGFGGVGGIAGSLVFRDQDSPTYHPGAYACIACCLLTVVLVCILSVAFYVENGKQARGEKRLESQDDDVHGDFRYTY
ncbi:major facilitator superfamily transporter [Pseudovirgaria hyperparasitica]|uniref:Major facilitator superfamily transporter n=1 Tax=Pseudovirgaria hyperparasitica TaxID=470096 RepID=A0A6A6VRB0_9PEZI|nr:major facilitator superfamily transporter [Pseudovirgaria hyperparasitica]KAF2753132.1 major facilitator superfamily transporter [Pseudovirgaria hyperparasitica]